MVAREKKAKQLWEKCPACDQIIYKKELAENFKICPKCGHYLRMSAWERIEMLADSKDGALCFTELEHSLCSQDPLSFGDPLRIGESSASDGKQKSSYLAKLESEARKTGLSEAVVCGKATIGTHLTVLAVMDFSFMGGSMGSVVGEKVARAIELALKEKLPLIIVSSSGGARMQEGILSLMQMAKTATALAKLADSSVPYISVLCDPTTGGVTASYSMLGDIILAEPKALIAFAGPRVIEQTIKQKLPEGFQQAEFLLQHGMVDCVVERKNLKSQIVKFLNFFSGRMASPKKDE